jgi:hypothetical protein
MLRVTINTCHCVTNLYISVNTILWKSKVCFASFAVKQIKTPKINIQNTYFCAMFI